MEREKEETEESKEDERWWKRSIKLRTTFTVKIIFIVILSDDLDLFDRVSLEIRTHRHYVRA